MGSIDKACISGFLCRLCSEMHRIVIHIYGDQGKKLCLVEKINGYLPITISPTDPLPKTICETCLRRVEQHYDLLMRLSRMKEERLLHKKLQRPTVLRCAVTDVTDTDSSGDEMGNSQEELRNAPRELCLIPSTSATSNTSLSIAEPLEETLFRASSSNRGRRGNLND